MSQRESKRSSLASSPEILLRPLQGRDVEQVKAIEMAWPLLSHWDIGVYYGVAGGRQNAQGLVAIEKESDVKEWKEEFPPKTEPHPVSPLLPGRGIADFVAALNLRHRRARTLAKREARAGYRRKREIVPKTSPRTLGSRHLELRLAPVAVGEA